jgi:hypothetical protein
VTTIYLAYGSGAKATLERHANDGPVDLLVAYPELKAFEKNRHKFNVRKLCIDSGAFSVFNSGKSIDVNEYIAACKGVVADEIFGLDVIGNAKETRRNLDAMWKAGIKAIPTFHRGSPWSELKWCADNADKIAFGGVAKLRGKKREEWLAQALSRVWPKKIHAFGCTSHESIAVGPWHSIDSTSWCFAPAAMGSWQGFTGRQVRLKSRGVNDYWVEVLEFQRRAEAAKFRWRKQLAQLEGKKR